MKGDKREQDKYAFLATRLEVVGRKIVLKLEAGKVPSDEEAKFFDKCYGAITGHEPALAMRQRWMDLPLMIAEAKAKRAKWLESKAKVLAEKAAAKAAAPKPVVIHGAVFKPETVAELETVFLSAEGA